MDLNKIVRGLVGSGVVSGVAGGVAGGAVSSALLSKKGRKHAGTLLKVGGLAAVGGLAWKAYRGYQQTKTEADPGAASGPRRAFAPRSLDVQAASVAAAPASALAQDSRGLLVIRAMIAAAMADGHIDGKEQTLIFRRLAEVDLRDHEKGLILDELRRPATAEQLVEQCTDIASSLEVYAASVLAIDTSCPAGRVYLDNLAELLALPPVLVRNVREQTLAPADIAGNDADHRAGQQTGHDRAA